MGKAATPNWRIQEKRVKVNGRARYLWQAVDESGTVLDFYVTETRDEASALRFLKQALKAR